MPLLPLKQTDSFGVSLAALTLSLSRSALPRPRAYSLCVPLGVYPQAPDAQTEDSIVAEDFTSTSRTHTPLDRVSNCCSSSPPVIHLPRRQQKLSIYVTQLASGPSYRHSYP